MLASARSTGAISWRWPAPLSFGASPDGAVVAAANASARGQRHAILASPFRELTGFVLAASLPPEELNRVGFRLYERFRPDVPDGAQGWGAKGELRVARIRGAGA